MGYFVISACIMFITLYGFKKVQAYFDDVYAKLYDLDKRIQKGGEHHDNR